MGICGNAKCSKRNEHRFKRNRICLVCKSKLDKESFILDNKRLEKLFRSRYCFACFCLLNSNSSETRSSDKNTLPSLAEVSSK